MSQNVDAGRLERRVRRVGRETMPGTHGFCSFYSFGAIRGKLVPGGQTIEPSAHPAYKALKINNAFLL